MGEKYQVFISSTFQDLAIQRKAAIQVVVDCRHIPIALDTFGARSVRDREVIDTMIEESQILILIIGHRYGHMLDENNCSYTEYEYDKAVKCDLRVLAFFLDEQEAQEMLEEAVQDPVQRAGELLRLKQFRESVKAGAMYSPWHKDTSFDQFLWLIGKSLKDLINNEKKPPRSGWVPASRQKTAKTVEIALRNEFVLDTVESLNNFERLDKRCNEQSEEKRALAIFFRDHLGQLITSGKLDVFFDSGSTPAYVARQVGKLLLDRPILRSHSGGAPRIFTNNALAFFQLWLNARLPISLLPSSPPSDPYGACFGTLEGLIDRNGRPQYDQRSLSHAEATAVEELRVELTDSLGESRSLIVGAASGVQLSEDHDLYATGNSKVTNAARTAVQQCYGFHVGSIYNKLFKRALYETRFPVLIAIDHHKVDHSIDVNRCHFIFDREFSWEDFIADYPLAFCVGGPAVRIEHIVNQLSNLGFGIERAPESWEPAAIIATNLAFRSQFPEIYS